MRLGKGALELVVLRTKFGSFTGFSSFLSEGSVEEAARLSESVSPNAG